MLGNLHGRLDHAFRKVETGAAIGAGLTIVALMVLVTLDAVLRRAFGSPLTFQLMLSENYLLVAMAMLSLAWGYRRGGTIRVQLVVDLLPPPVADKLVRAGLAVSSVYMAALARLAWENFYQAYVDNEVMMGVIDWPVAWSWVWIPIGCGLLAVRLLIDVCKPGSVLQSPDPHAKPESTGE